MPLKRNRRTTCRRGRWELTTSTTTRAGARCTPTPQLPCWTKMTIRCCWRVWKLRRKTVRRLKMMNKKKFEMKFSWWTFLTIWGQDSNWQGRVKEKGLFLWQIAFLKTWFFFSDCAISVGTFLMNFFFYFVVDNSLGINLHLVLEFFFM